MKDRVPTYPGRVKLTPVSGQANTYDMVRADSPTQEGTPINKDTLLKDTTATALGLTGDPTVDEAFAAIAAKASVDSLVIEKITSSCNWTAPKAVGQKFKVYAVGGGGGATYSYGSNQNYGGGGGGGHVAVGTFEIPQGTNVPIVCGAGGHSANGTASSQVTGATGGTTTFGSMLSAAGGSGGKSSGYFSGKYVVGAGGSGGSGGGGGYLTSGYYGAGAGGDGGTYGGGGGVGSAGGGDAVTGGDGGTYGGGGGGSYYHSGGKGGTYGGDGASGVNSTVTSSKNIPATDGTQIHNVPVSETLLRPFNTIGAKGISMLDASGNIAGCAGGGGYGGNGGSIVNLLTNGSTWTYASGAGGGGYGGNGGGVRVSTNTNGGGGGGNYGGDGGFGGVYGGGGGGGLFANGGDAEHRSSGTTEYVWGGSGGGIDSGDAYRNELTYLGGGNGGCYIVYVKGA